MEVIFVEDSLIADGNSVQDKSVRNDGSMTTAISTTQCTKCKGAPATTGTIETDSSPTATASIVASNAPSASASGAVSCMYSTWCFAMLVLFAAAWML